MALTGKLVMSSTTNTPEEVNAALGIKAEETKTEAVKTEVKTEEVKTDAAVDTKATEDVKVEETEKVTEPTEEEKAAAAAEEVDAEKRRVAAKAGGEKHGKLDRRIKELVDERNEARGEKEALRVEVDALRKKLEASITGEAKKTETAAADDDPKPLSKDFPEYDDWIEALADWKARAVTAKVVVAERAKADEAAKQAKTDSNRTEIMARFDKSIATARDRYEDYDEVLQTSSLDVHQVVQQAMMESEQSADIAYFLAMNPDEGEALYKLGNTTAAVKYLGRIEAKVEAFVEAHGKKGEAPKVEKKAAAAAVDEKPKAEKPKVAATKATEPISPVKAGSATSAPPADQLDYKAYKAMRAREKAIASGAVTA